MAGGWHVDQSSTTAATIELRKHVTTEIAC
jgi:hypothetical protein